MHVPPSFIKNVALEIDPDYDLQNTPISPSNGAKREALFPVLKAYLLEVIYFLRLRVRPSRPVMPPPFIGRKLHIDKMLAFLNARSKNGVFLVTGYRGMGKTSFVNHVLNKYRQDRKTKFDDEREQRIKNTIWLYPFRKLRLYLVAKLKKRYRTNRIITINLTVAQNNPKELDILRLIVMSVFDEYRSFITRSRRWSLYVNLDIRQALKLALIPFLVMLSPLALWVTPSGSSYLSFVPNFLQGIVISSLYANLVIGFSLILVLVYLLVSFLIYFQQNKKSAFNRIRWLVERCYSTLSEENSSTDEANVPVINIKLGKGEKRTKQYPIATTKEMEYELQIFLKKAFQDHKLEFIFVFDELDKLDAPIAGTYLYDEPSKVVDHIQESAYERELRERKQAIINIITGLKNFFTTANAHFVFIAGREMFDASLADISDRQSPISSIFTYVFNIESLLKERDLLGSKINNASLSYGIEVYLKNIIFGSSKPEDTQKSLFELIRKYYKDIVSHTEYDFDKLYFTLQNFVTYLTYRSNGSPKKLIKEIHEFIRVDKDDLEIEHGQTLVYWKSTAQPDRRFLYFSYENQYRTGFINYLYRPFLIRYGRSFKHYSDNIIVSTPYLFDHFLKFHPFAFSLSNLELIPEMLSSNKTPSLREHIRQIINYLSGSHIREIEIGLFDYKFYSRTLNEITYLSKIFEQEAAALNYTLDESHLVKLHVRNKIRDLRNTYAKFLDGDGHGGKITSIAHLNGILGDLHFFDQEYDDAIVAYEDAIRVIENQSSNEFNRLDFIILLRNRLKAGLCYEKMSSYEFALSSYSDASDDSVRYMAFRLQPGIPGMESIPKLDPYTIPGAAKPVEYYSGPLSDLLQIVLQSFSSQIYIQEKKSVAGISELKLFMSIGAFLNITGGFMFNSTRNHIIKAQAFLQAGNLLYFKNNEELPDLNSDTFEKILPDAFKKNMALLLNWKFEYGAKTVRSKPVMALMMYFMALNEMANYKHHVPNFLKSVTRKPNLFKEMLKDFNLKKIDEDKDSRGIYYNYTATVISAIGDCMLASYVKGTDRHKFNIEDIFLPEAWTVSLTANNGLHFDQLLKPTEPEVSGMHDILRSYYTAAGYFLKQGKFSNSSFLYKKILYTLRLVLKSETLEEPALKIFYANLRKTLVEPLIDFAEKNAAYGATHMRNKAINDGADPVYTEQNLSNHPDTREVWLLYNYIILKTGKVEIEDMKYLVASKNSFATQYARIQELQFYGQFLRRKFRQENYKSTLEDQIDYLYTMLSVLQILDIYGSDYWMGYSYLANTHYQVAVYLIESFPDGEFPEDLQTRLSKLMGEGSFSSLDAKNHFLKSLDYYGKAERLHSAGEEYKETISDMTCMEDDFNDSAYHFGAALDRYKINNGLFEERIKDCRKKLGDLGETVMNNV